MLKLCAVEMKYVKMVMTDSRFSFCGTRAANATNFDLATVLPLCLVSELPIPFSLGLKPRTSFQCCEVCSSNNLTKTNNLYLETVFLLWLVSKLRNPPLLRLEPRTFL